MNAYTIRLVCLLAGLLCSVRSYAQDSPYGSIQLDTVSLPGTMSEDDRIISFYQRYVGKPGVAVHLVANSSPDSRGENWKTVFARGTLRWVDEVHLRGEIEVIFDSEAEEAEVVINSIFRSRKPKATLEIDSRDGDVTLTLDGNFLYQTEIRNKSIYGFNGANRMIVITFERD